MADIMNTNPTEILENFRNAYYNQIGVPMQIGSEEYTLSSVYSYVMSAYAALVNQSYKNQVLATASGEFLDNIGKRYGLTRTPESFSNPWFEGFFIISETSSIYTDPEHSDHIYDAGELSINIKGKTFVNRDEVYIARIPDQYSNIIPFSCRFVCESTAPLPFEDSQFRSIYLTAEDEDGNLAFDPACAAYSDLVMLVQASHELNDEEFRKYIDEHKYIFCPGMANAYESVTELSTPYISDARCRTQNDPGFIPGNVDLYIKPIFLNKDISYGSVEDLVSEQDVDAIKETCTGAGIITIGQTLNVHVAAAVSDKRRYTFYIAPEYNTPVNIHLYKLKFNAALGWLNNHMKIGETYIASKAVQIMKQDLSTLSTNLRDFGIVDTTSDEYIYFDKYCALPIYGTAAVQGQIYPTQQNGGSHTVGANQYILLLPPTTAQMNVEPSYTGDGTAGNPKMYAYNYAVFNVLKGVEQ